MIVEVQRSPFALHTIQWVRTREKTHGRVVDPIFSAGSMPWFEHRPNSKLSFPIGRPNHVITDFCQKPGFCKIECALSLLIKTEQPDFIETQLLRLFFNRVNLVIHILWSIDRKSLMNRFSVSWQTSFDYNKFLRQECNFEFCIILQSNRFTKVIQKMLFSFFIPSSIF